ncbi:MAG: methylglutamate dehydrogenase [Gammaproteobacteria bacterium]|jgi:sarcosine oxidase, subunit gamma|nr:methylglutamate dehydrogenase [Gammaproteobacteria bacterium]MBU0771404.1 methylglutamate dehydrogenase [Gammaproteobacteria bacterium]MBU0857080.1 methylglutamate dehydrogenase [Gammaproteobacteria bacterium]MBU1847958.1 methylglutamate dehydrogenase [Gammaproteobacteria bacterium]
MNAPIRISPLFDVQAPLGPKWSHVDAMQTPASFGSADGAKLALAGIGDVSFRRRAGVKGPGAAAALAELGIATPERPNSFLRMACGTLVARMGRTEFMVEDAAGGTRTAQMHAQTPGAGVYPVPRFDAALVVTGERAIELFRQSCAFDFSSLVLPEQPLVMTSMVGVGVTVVAIDDPSGPYYRVWCDGTYGGYLWATLVEVASDLGGGAVGLEALGRLAQ